MSAFTYRGLYPSQEALRIEFARCSREPLSWKEELYAAARTVANRSKRPLWLCSSGGMDSEVMCQAFFDQGIHFSVLTLEHLQGTNRHDTRFAKRWCVSHDVPHRILPIDIDAFLTKEIDAYTSDTYVADRVFRYLQLHLLEAVERMEGFAVLGGGEQIYRLKDRKDPSAALCIEFRSGFLAALEWCRRNGTDHEPYFFYSTPEAVLSYLRLPVIDFALQHPHMFRHRTTGFTLKRLAFQTTWHDIKTRGSYSGFEQISPKVVEIKKQLRERFRDELRMYELSVEELRNQLQPNG